MVGGPLSDHKGVNVPDIVLPIPALTAKDRDDLDFALEHGVDYIGLSFVQRPEDVVEAQGADRRPRLGHGQAGEAAGAGQPRRHHAAVRRGDGGARRSRRGIAARGGAAGAEGARARRRLAGKPVVVATQMLESMITAPAPTRAEASDVATAVFDGADAVMLSAETAAGQYPYEAVDMMDRIVARPSSHKLYRSIIEALAARQEQTPPHAVRGRGGRSRPAIHAAAIVAFTSSGTTAARIARKRPRVPILAITPSEQVSRRLCLLWGAHSVLSERRPELRGNGRARDADRAREEFAATDRYHRRGRRHSVRPGRHDQQPARRPDWLTWTNKSTACDGNLEKAVFRQWPLRANSGHSIITKKRCCSFTQLRTLSIKSAMSEMCHKRK